MTKAKKLVLFTLIFFSLFFLALKIVIPDFYIFTKNSQLTKGLSSEISVAEKQLNSRVQEVFSAKTHNRQISDELSRLGFMVENDQKGKMRAFFQESDFPCNRIWLITWDVDDQGYIYNLKARYYNTSCL